MTAIDAGLERRMAGGALWMIGARLLSRGAAFLNMLILARLLTPHDFGTVALAMAFMAAFMALSDFSFGAALIQNQSATREDYDTVFTLSLARGALIALLVWSGSQAAADFFKAPDLAGAARALAFSALLEGLRSPAAVNLAKSLDFRRDFLYVAGPRLFQTLVSALVALWLWRDSRALTAAILAGAVAGVILSYVLAPWRPRLTLSALPRVLDYAKWMFAFNAVDFLRQKMDAFLIGRLIGPGAVSVWMLAMDLANLAATEIAAPARRAITPGYAKAQNEPALLARGFGLAFAAMAMAAAPMAAGVALIAEPLVRLAFGPQWSEAAPTLQILALAGFFAAASGNAQSAAMALGAPKALAPAALASLIVGAPAMALGLVKGGLAGGAWGMVLMNLVFGVLNLRSALRSLNLPLAAVLAPLKRLPGAILAMAGAVLAVRALVPWSPEAGELAAARVCVLATAAGAAAYAAAFWGLWRMAGRPPGVEAAVARWINRRLKRG